MNKPREFWIYWNEDFINEPLGRIHNIQRMVCNYDFKPSIHVREVVELKTEELEVAANAFIPPRQEFDAFDMEDAFEAGARWYKNKIEGKE